MRDIVFSAYVAEKAGAGAMRRGFGSLTGQRFVSESGVMGLINLGRLASLSAAAMLGLAGCQTPEQLAAQDDAACSAIGISSGNARYGECRMLMERKRISERQEAAARMQAFGAAMASGSQSLNTSNAGSYSSAAPGGACFKSGERISGFNKVCLYNCTGSTVATNVASTSLCPLTIQN